MWHFLDVPETANLQRRSMPERLQSLLAPFVDLIFLPSSKGENSLVQPVGIFRGVFHRARPKNLDILSRSVCKREMNRIAILARGGAQAIRNAKPLNFNSKISSSLAQGLANRHLTMEKPGDDI